MSTDDQMDPRGSMRHWRNHAAAQASHSVSALDDYRKGSTKGQRQFVVDHLMRAILSVTPFCSETLLEELISHRVAVNNISDNYVPHAARLLGTLWAEDDISFAQVTIGTLRLQSVVELATNLAPVDLSYRADRPHALVLVPRQEQHFLGASVLFGQLRRLSCDVAMSFHEDEQTLTDRLIRESTDIVLISCSRLENIATVAKTVQIVRVATNHACAIALGGAVDTDAAELKDMTGVDIVTNCPKDALAFCAVTRKMVSRQ